MKRRILFFVAGIIVAIVSMSINGDPVSGGLFAFLIIMIGYVGISIFRAKKRLGILDDKCDPYEFLTQTEKQREITGKNKKINSYLEIDRAAGNILIGDFNKGLEILLAVDKSKLSKTNGTLLVYYINLMECYYELGEVEKAEEVFETEIPLLSSINKNIVLAKEVILAERLFFLKRYEDAKEKYNELLNRKLSKRIRISLIYRLAQINDYEEKHVEAKVQYKEVAEQGNKLWIAEEAKKRNLEIEEK